MSLLVSREWEMPIAIVVLFNATIGHVQESRAEASLEALRTLSVTIATVRRDGRILRLDAGELVPGAPAARHLEAVTQIRFWINRLELLWSGIRTGREGDSGALRKAIRLRVHRDSHRVRGRLPTVGKQWRGLSPSRTVVAGRQAGDA
ncbi:hypothetical protein [Krasilnikovia sp. M28-CT-15]|uniref:hypothetical protein n=1 Tax=Krasilnikovia sp. M28-CT-15 TaxID=3373540 RepID=UPI00399C8786